MLAESKSSGASQIKYLLLVSLGLVCLIGLLIVLKNELQPKLARAWWDSGWANRMPLFFNNADQSEDLTDFPVLVHLTAEHFDFNQTQDNGEDIRFIDADDSTPLAYEIELWDKTARQAYIWVKVPQIDHNSTTDFIWLYWGNDAAGDGQSAAATWGNGYEQVLHFNEGSGDWVADSTNNLNRAFLKNNDSVGWVADGKVGWAYDFDGVDDLASVKDNPNHSLDLTDQITIEAWVNPSGYQKEEGEITRVKDSYKLGDGNSGIYYHPDLIQVNGDLYLAAYSMIIPRSIWGNGWLKTFTVDEAGGVVEKGSWQYESGTRYAANPDLIHVSGDLYAVFYSYGSPPAWPLAYIRTFWVNSNGAITSTGKSLNLGTSRWGTGEMKEIIQVGSEYFAGVYQDNDTGYIKTVRIISDGTISNVSSRTLSSAGDLDIEHIANDVYAIVYSNKIITRTISPTGAISSSNLSSRTFTDLPNGHHWPVLLYLADNVYALAAASNNTGRINTFTIDNNGTIGQSDLAPLFQFETDNITGSMQLSFLDLGNNKYSVVYENGYNYYRVKTLTINPDGTFPVQPIIDDYINDGMQGRMIFIADYIYAIAYSYNTDVWLATIGIYKEKGLSKNNPYAFDADNVQAYGWINKKSLAGAIAPGWNYAVLTYDKNAGSEQVKLYVNGIQKSAANYNQLINVNDADLLFGHLFNGAIDELRISSVARSSDWVKAQYLNMAETFLPDLFISFAGQSGQYGEKWAWAETFGWFSLDCQTDECQAAGNNYEVVVPEAGGEVEGWAWSEYAGWVCFGKSCDEAPGLGSNPGGGPNYAYYNKGQYSGDIEGWANIVVLGENGWLSLRSSDREEPPDPSYVFKPCYDCDTDAEGSFCRICYTAEDWGGSGKICSACQGCQPENSTCGTCDYCDSYGLAYDRQTNKISGWAWNGNWPYSGGWQDNGKPPGLGWLTFNYDNSLTVPPWLQTLSGDIYAGNFIRGAFGTPPIGQTNATYLIHVGVGVRDWEGSVSNFITQCEAYYDEQDKKEKCVDTDYRQLILPTSTIYGQREFVGPLDRAGILAGDYGKVIDCVAEGHPALLDCLGSPVVLAGQVYYFANPGDAQYTLTVNAPVTITNNQLNPGNGLIVVEGNLVFEADVRYNDQPATNLNQLASVGWLVLEREQNDFGGNIIVSSEVSNLVGAFYSQNNIDTCEETGYLVTCRDRFLDVKGLMVAESFFFDRDYTGPRAAERVVDNGRALVNPPPGFTDLTKALPIWQQVAP